MDMSIPFESCAYTARGARGRRTMRRRERGRDVGKIMMVAGNLKDLNAVSDAIVWNELEWKVSSGVFCR